MYDTIIIGAGPVGSYLARKLAHLGYNVLVLEKKASAGQDICCTGIISKECLDLLQPDNNLIMRQVSSAKFLAPSGKPLGLWRNHKVAYIIDRPSLNLEMAKRAQESGACYLFGVQGTNIQIQTERLQVLANCGGKNILFESETAALATGFGSSLPARLGLGEIKHFVIGAQAGVSAKNLEEVEIYLDRRLAPGGFAWLVPTKDNGALAGLLTHYQPEQHLNNLLSTLKIKGKISSTEATPGYGAIPLRTLPRTYTDRILVVGEAAGQVKPTTGGGIYYGLLCADIAADTIHRALQANDFSKSRLAAYQKGWKSIVGKELQIGYWVHRLFRKLDNRQIEWLHNFINRSDIPRFIAEFEDFSFDRHSEIILKTLKHLAFASPARAIKTLREINATTN